MPSHQDVCQRWADRAAGTTDKKLLKGSRIFGDDNTIYSYGHHFALAHALRDKNDTTVLFLLNGDRFSVSTTQHQSHIRSAVDRTPVPSVIIPFTALDAAGIDLKTVELIHAERQRVEEIRHSSRVRPEGSVWRTEETHGYVRKSDEVIAELVTARQRYNPDFTEERLQEYETHQYIRTGTVDRLYTAARGGSLITVSEDEQGTLYTWTTTRHWLGESLIRAQVTTARRVNCRACKGSGREAEGWTDERFGGLSFYCRKCDARGGRTVFSTRKAFFLSGFDRNERRPSYFFCELPKDADVTSVDEAYEALKPQTVLTAEASGREVARQGDIFAISLPSLDKRTLRRLGATFTKSGNLLGTNHEATEVAVLPNGTTIARGSLRHNPGFRAPDHRRVKLSDGWHVIVKNTVPVTKR